MDKFVVYPNDGIFVTKAKQEANIYLASSKTPDEDIHKFADLISLCQVFDGANKTNHQYYQEVLNLFNNFINKGILAPLTLKDDEFENKYSNAYHVNKRYPDIIKNGVAIINTNAYKLNVKKFYDDEFGIELAQEEKILSHCPKLYISKGGVITGEYIQDCIIDNKNIGCYTIQSIISIPASSITFKREDMEWDTIYVVDHREPKLKVLQEFYEVPILHSEYIKSQKLNIRKYTKLNHNKYAVRNKRNSLEI